MDRRGFLGSLLAAGVAPAVVKIQNLMPIFNRGATGLWMPEQEIVAPVLAGGNQILTIDQITKEALRILHKNLTFMHSQSNLLRKMT